MKPYIRNSILGIGLAASVGVAGVAADILVTAGTGTTIFTFTCQTTKLCPAAVTIRSDGTEVGTDAVPFRNSTIAWGSASAPLGAPSNYGTSPGAVAVPGVNAFVTNTVAANATLSTETTKVIGQTGVAQASTTATQVGPLVQCAATTAAPTYVTAQTDPLSCDLAGNLRTITRNLGATGAVLDFAGQNAASPLNSWLTGGQFNTTPTTIASGNSSPLQLDANGNLKVSAGTASNWAIGVIGAGVPTNAQYLGMSVGGTLTGLTGTGGNLNINCQAGCTAGTGTFNNNADNVATSATNGQVAAWNYVWDGATWDRLPGDSTNGAKVNVTNANVNGQATAANSSPVVQAGFPYEMAAAGVTGQILGGAGAVGDYLSHCVIYPQTTTPGSVHVFDGATDTSGTVRVIDFPGGASSVSNLVPFAIPVGALSVVGGWRVSTGANVTVTCVGRFT